MSVTIVVATMNRRDELLDDLPRLLASGAAEVVVVDNGSADGTAEAVRRRFTAVRVVALPRNIGCAARTVGAQLARTPYLAFADDDSWWDADALAAAVALLEADPGLALVTGEVRVEPDGHLDPVSEAQAGGAYDTRWQRTAAGRRAVAGFLACAVVCDRAAYLAAGGFEQQLGIGGEEELLALDLASIGWRLAYAPEAVARHAPSASRDPRARAARLARNHVLTAVARHPWSTVARRCRQLDRASAATTVRGLPWALAVRRPGPQAVAERFAAM